MKFVISIIATVFLTFSANAEILFSDLNLNSSSQMIFSARSRTPSGSDFSVWFSQSLADKSAPQPLTYPVQSATWLSSIGQLQIQNPFGVWRIDGSTTTVRSVSPLVFGKDETVATGKSLPQSYSPDGKYVLFWDRKDTVTASLVLQEIATGQTTVLSEGLELSYQGLPAEWSPTGQFVVYSKNDTLYYFSLVQWAEARVPDEALRALGPGLISSVCWGSSGELYYLSDSVLFRILPEEFFTRSLYRARFQTWGVLASVPFMFHPESDRFWLAPDQKSILVAVSGRIVFFYPLGSTGFQTAASPVPLSYLPLPESARIVKVLWTPGNRVTMLVDSLQGEKILTQVIRLSANSVAVLDAGSEAVRDLQTSPDGAAVALVNARGLSIRDISTFSETKSVRLDGLVSVFWESKSRLWVAGRGGVYTVSSIDGTSQRIVPGTLDQIGFQADEKLAAKISGRSYTWDVALQNWASAQDATLSAPSAANTSYRVYLSDLPSGPFQNTILIRDLAASLTRELIPKPRQGYRRLEDNPEDGGDGVSESFSHGSRTRARELALIIDAVDSSEGLAQVLRGLQDWGFKATFFINGEFLRRNPLAAQEIAASGQQTASLFHIPLDLTSRDFVIDADFVRQGLARQEDDWYALTGKELSLFWHPPWWKSQPELLEGARAAGYRTLGTDLPVAPLVVKRSEWIRSVVDQVRPGSVLALTLGMKDSTTGESFFNRWDVLLSALSEAGFTGVSVSELVDHSRS